jgi:RNA polymerase-binding protein DksA
MSRFDQVKEHLEKKLAGLTSRVTKIESTLRDPSAADSEERATESENDEVLERLDDAGLREMQEIRRALRRLESGTYGMCTSCGEMIPEGRLKALPYTGVCIDCA